MCEDQIKKKIINNISIVKYKNINNVSSYSKKQNPKLISFLHNNVLAIYLNTHFIKK